MHTELLASAGISFRVRAAVLYCEGYSFMPWKWNRSLPLAQRVHAELLASAVFWSDNIKFQRLDGILCSENMDKSRCWGFDTWVTQGITKECSCFLTILFGSLDCVMSCYTCLQGKAQTACLVRAHSALR